MNKIFVVIAVFFALLLPTIAFAATPIELPRSVALPPDDDLEFFPIMSGPLSNDDMAQMGLVVVRLPREIWVDNWNPINKTIQSVLVHAGTLVLRDETGRLRYIASCGNRIFPRIYVRNFGPNDWEWEPPLEVQLADVGYQLSVLRGRLGLPDESAEPASQKQDEDLLKETPSGVSGVGGDIDPAAPTVEGEPNDQDSLFGENFAEKGLGLILLALVGALALILLALLVGLGIVLGRWLVGLWKDENPKDPPPSTSSTHSPFPNPSKPAHGEEEFREARMTNIPHAEDVVKGDRSSTSPVSSRVEDAPRSNRRTKIIQLPEGGILEIPNKLNYDLTPEGGFVLTARHGQRATYTPPRS